MGVCFSVAGFAAISFLFLSSASAADKWGAHLESGAKLGSQRSIGEMDAFIPVAQDDSSLLFLDFRGKFDDDASREGNFGLGYRHIMDGSWIAGTYVFYDRRRTELGNLFNQATLGFELLGEDWDIRANGYLPQGGARRIGGTGADVAAISGSSFSITSTTASRERALPGFDAEAGYRLPLDWAETRLFFGGFHFEAAGYPSVTGPRARLEFAWNDLPLIGEGSRLTLGGEVQTDNVRGDQGFLMARLRIPLNRPAERPRLSPIERRMTTYVERDVDIVAGTRVGQTVTEAASAVLPGGGEASSFTTVDAIGNIVTAVSGAGANSLVVVDGSAGTVNTAAAVTLNSGQSVVGGGTQMTVRSASGKTGTVTLPGTAPTVNGTNAGVNVFVMAADSELANMTVNGGLNGVRVNAANGSRLTDLTISGTGEDGIEILATTGLTARGITIDNPGGGTQDGVQFESTSSDISFTNLTISNAASGIVFTGASTYTNTSFASTTATTLAGNVVDVAGASILASPSGSISASGVGGVACNNLGTMNSSTLQINSVTCQ